MSGVSFSRESLFSPGRNSSRMNSLSTFFIASVSFSTSTSCLFTCLSADPRRGPYLRLQGAGSETSCSGVCVRRSWLPLQEFGRGQHRVVVTAPAGHADASTPDHDFECVCEYEQVEQAGRVLDVVKVVLQLLACVINGCAIRK